MVVMQPLVWISIFLTLIASVFNHHLYVQSVRVSACFSSFLPCHSYSMNCSGAGNIQVDRMQYGLYGSRKDQCQSTCGSSCCSYLPNDCLEDFNQYHADLLTNKCLGLSSCEGIQAVQKKLKEPNSCSNDLSQYVIIDYTCVHGGENKQQQQPLSIIIGVVVAAVVLLVIAVVAIIWYKSRIYKKPVEEDYSKNDPPSVLLNRSVVSCKDLNISNAAVEKSNYDVINEESVSNYYQPVKQMKGERDVSKDKRNDGKDISSEEYDRIEFEKKSFEKPSNYDSLTSADAKISDNTYSHVPGQSNYAPTPAANDYSHCNIDRKDSFSNDHSSREESIEEGDYSHADLDVEWKSVRLSSTKKQDPYCRVDFNKTKNS